MEACGWFTNSHWAPTVCIHVPTLLTSTASQSARKTPFRSGAQVDSAEVRALTPLVNNYGPPDGADRVRSGGVEAAQQTAAEPLRRSQRRRTQSCGSER